MGWEDRPYYRDRGQAGFNPLGWALGGSIPLFTAFGVRVRAHASLVILAVLLLLLGIGEGFSWQARVISITVLFAVVLLHEFGHVFMARWVGGDANEIMMTPLGGLAFASPPRRPLPTFLTVAAGPAVNVLICILCGVVIWLTLGVVPFNPFSVFGEQHRPRFDGWFQVGFYAYWVYGISYWLLLFNLWPVYPLDGGQMLQAALWPVVGYYKSMKFACVTGMIGSVVMAMVGLATFPNGLILLFIAVSCFLTCLSRWRVLKEVGPDGLGEEEDGVYSAAYEMDPSMRRRKRGRLRQWWSARKAIQAHREEQGEQEQIDRILAKVSAQGMNSLTWREKRILRQATEHQRQRELEQRRR